MIQGKIKTHCGACRRWASDLGRSVTELCKEVQLLGLLFLTFDLHCRSQQLCWWRGKLRACLMRTQPG